MEYRPLGGMGLQVSVLGLGTAGIGQLYETLSDEEGAAVVSRALDLGLTYLDTAPLYGYGASERRVGLALRAHPHAAQCLLATKVGFFPEGFDYGYDDTMRSVEASLRRLGLSTLPLVQIHEITPGNWPAVFAPRGGLAALRALQAQGAVTHIGVTGSDLPTLLAAVETHEFATMLVWRHYHLLDIGAAPLIARAAARGMGVIVGTPFAGGLLASGDTPSAHYFYAPAGPAERARTRRIEAACAARGVPLAAAALRFCASPTGVSTVIAGADRPAHVQRNAQTMATPVPPDLLEELPLLAR